MAERAPSTFFFLFRSDAGRIDRDTWWRGTVPLVSIAVLMTLGWLALRPYAFHDLGLTPFLDPATLVAYLYLVIYAFALILIAICEYNLSAKRFRDRGRPASLAALLPATLFLVGAVIWFIPHSFGEVPGWAEPLALVVALAVGAWNVVELGLDRGARARS